MSFNKALLAAAVLALASAAHAVVTPVVVQPPIGRTAPVVHAPFPSAVDPEPAPAHVAAPVVASAALASGTVIEPGAVVSTASDSHLLLGQIDKAARIKVLKAIRKDADGDLSGAGMGGGMGGPQVPAPILNQVPPTIAATSIHAPIIPVVPSDNVSFVGTNDTQVMYRYNGGVYSAAIGQKMLNGVTAKRIQGLSVTVTDGKRTWDVPVSAHN